MTKNYYIVFYTYFKSGGGTGSGVLDKIEVRRKENTYFDVMALNELVRDELVDRGLLEKSDQLIITNIINQKTL